MTDPKIQIFKRAADEVGVKYSIITCSRNITLLDADGVPVCLKSVKKFPRGLTSLPRFTFTAPLLPDGCIVFLFAGPASEDTDYVWIESSGSSNKDIHRLLIPEYEPTGHHARINGVTLAQYATTHFCDPQSKRYPLVPQNILYGLGKVAKAHVIDLYRQINMDGELHNLRRLQ